jgi:uncharacterized protein
VQVIPLQFAVPLVVLLDLVGTTLVGGRNWRHVSWRELLDIVPAMLVGVAIGITLLARVEAKWPLIALGVFVIAMAIRNARPPRAGMQPIARRWGALFGAAGGVFSALFGTGGPIYVIYVARRLTDPERLRATVSVVILSSGITRVVGFGASSFYADHPILPTFVAVLPFCLAGVWIGGRLRSRASPRTLRHALSALLALGGAAALYRGIVS